MHITCTHGNWEQKAWHDLDSKWQSLVQQAGITLQGAGGADGWKGEKRKRPRKQKKRGQRHEETWFCQTLVKNAGHKIVAQIGCSSPQLQGPDVPSSLITLPTVWEGYLLPGELCRSVTWLHCSGLGWSIRQPEPTTTWGPGPFTELWGGAWIRDSEPRAKPGVSLLLTPCCLH